MKKMKCIDCGESGFKAETENEMMKTMMPHYMKKHKGMVAGQNNESKKEWYKRFHKEWEKVK